MDILQTIMQQLGVDEAQAKGGLGALFKLAKDKLGSEDFAKVEAEVPEASALADEAPEPESGGIAGALGSLLGGSDGALGKLGGLAGLAGIFSKLGLSPDMIAKFAGSALGFLKGKGATQVQGLLESVLE